ncbi:MAG: hypothetical protein ISS31_09375 [Kiritimatiellae bacterium]|nr:hypothetical protein [Kiritimatiellia bacterium]
MIRRITRVMIVLLILTGVANGVETVAAISPVHEAARYLIQICDATGQFEYRVNTDPSVRVTPKYNILRHAGTVYSLCMYEDRYPTALTRAAVARAVGFMQRNAIGGVGSHTNMLAVWSRPEINLGDDPLQAKLGGTGLGLVALTSAHRVGAIEADLGQLRKLAEFIRYMQEKNGRFVSKYIPSEGGRTDFWASLYYPGEAALGLIMLYEIDPNPAWLDAAMRALLYLSTSRHGDKDLPPDHWTLLAMHRLLRLPRSFERKRQYEVLEAHAAELCHSIIAVRAMNTRTVGFTGDGRTCASATRLEGLIAALPLLSDPRLRARTQHAVDQGIEFLLGTQLRSGFCAGGWPRAARKLPKGHSGYTSSFNRRATEVRIDYVQHAMSALLMYEAVKPGH